MAYPPRICFPGAHYHITARGDNREPIFLDDIDYQQYWLLLRRYKDRFRFALHAYALMPNHVHLLLAAPAGVTISRLMQSLTIAYTRYFNQRHKRVGHVFQGRFHSRLMEDDTYLVVASRYVHLNPVRAKLVRDPAAWYWSSYGAYQEIPQDPLSLTDVEFVLAVATPGSRQPRAAYRQLVESSLETESADPEMAELISDLTRI
jgi:REP element-mobilizing transposase RayT